MHTFLPRVAAALVAVVAVLAVAPAASAHVSPFPSTAAAGGYTTVELQIPHGCEGQATKVVSVQLRDDITSVKAQAVPGWQVSYDRQPLAEPIQPEHGDPISDYVASITWTATGEPLADDQYQRFGISMKMPELAGETVLLPTVQTCVDGSESTWLDADPEAEHPAPAVQLVAAEDDGHGDSAGADSVDPSDEPVAEEASTEDAAGEQAAATAESEPDTVARVLAGVAIIVGLAACAIGLRRRTS